MIHVGQSDVSLVVQRFFVAHDFCTCQANHCGLRLASLKLRKLFWIFQNIPQDHSFQIKSQGLTLYMNIPRRLSSVYGNIFLTLPLDACKNGLRALFLQ